MYLCQYLCFQCVTLKDIRTSEAEPSSVVVETLGSVFWHFLSTVVTSQHFITTP